MARGKRGGTQRPRTPAVVSGPGALSQRTDGGPGKPIPPVAAGGQPYGKRKETEEIAAAADMYGSGGAPAPPIPGASQGAMPTGRGPTQRPTLPGGGGVTGSEQEIAPADMVLRAIYDAYPSPWIRALLDA